jgi:hypothetical protein
MKNNEKKKSIGSIIAMVCVIFGGISAFIAIKESDTFNNLFKNERQITLTQPTTTTTTTTTPIMTTTAPPITTSSPPVTTIPPSIQENNVPLPSHIKPVLPPKIDLSTINFTDSGTHAGRNISWEFGDGVLHFYGEGAMNNYIITSNPGWHNKRNQVHTVVISDGITHIGDRSFYNFNLLEYIEFPPTIETIGSNVFYNCVSLKSIFIPETVIKIGAHAFNGCINLKEVFLSEGIAEINSWAFANCTSLESIIIPKSVGEISFSSFRNSSNLREAHILSRVIRIGNDSFTGTSHDLVIYCFNNSTAETHANSNKINIKYYVDS